MSSKQINTTHACPFCGQVTTLEGLDIKEYKDVETRYLGAIACKCLDAEIWKRKHTNKRKAAEMIAELTTFAEARGVTITEADKLSLMAMSGSIIDKQFDGISIRMMSISIKLKLNKDDAFVFTVSYKEQFERQT